MEERRGGERSRVSWRDTGREEGERRDSSDSVFWLVAPGKPIEIHQVGIQEYRTSRK